MPSWLSVEGERRSRSKSPGGQDRDRSRSRSNVRIEDRTSERTGERRGSGHKSKNERRKTSKKHSESESESSSSEEDPRYHERRSSNSKKYYEPSDDDEKYRSRSRSEGRPTGPSASQPEIITAAPPAGFDYPPGMPGAFHDAPVRHMSYVGHDPRYAPPPPPIVPHAPSAAEVPYRPRAASNVGSGPQYADLDRFKYAQVDARGISYKPDTSAHPQTGAYDPRARPQYVEADPRDRHDREKKYREDKYGRTSGQLETKERDRRSSFNSAAGLGAGTLGVVAASAHNGHGKPPASPLLEAYKGTYQSISPMPNALVLAGHDNDSDLSDLELEEIDSDSDFGVPDNVPNADIKRKLARLKRERELEDKKKELKDKQEKKKAQKVSQEIKEYERQRPTRPPVENRDHDDVYSAMVVSPVGRKSVKFYDARDDAKEIAAALKGTTKAPDVMPLIRVLPRLSIDDLDALKVEYKKHARLPTGVGINMSKHIKTRVTGHIGTAAYACSLGQWESEASWANCFCQPGASRRELLIESLMGRTNQQVREIKDFFKDKKYDDDLVKCMKTELKADKFRNAILLALQAERMPESGAIDTRLVRQDVHDLHVALESAGGETAMINIIVLRSDSHLREVLRVYEQFYQRNFARDMINKSRNLVGETLAHILNGALNKPMRDALLIHQAIAETAPGKDRAELLISRLIRMHWDPKHLEKVKTQYYNRYRIRIEDAIKKEIQANMKTEGGYAWTNFCMMLVKSSEGAI